MPAREAATIERPSSVNLNQEGFSSRSNKTGNTVSSEAAKLAKLVAEQKEKLSCGGNCGQCTNSGCPVKRGVSLGNIDPDALNSIIAKAPAAEKADIKGSLVTPGTEADLSKMVEEQKLRQGCGGDCGLCTNTGCPVKRGVSLGEIDPVALNNIIAQAPESEKTDIEGNLVTLGADADLSKMVEEQKLKQGCGGNCGQCTNTGCPVKRGVSLGEIDPAALESIIAKAPEAEASDILGNLEVPEETLQETPLQEEIAAEVVVESLTDQEVSQIEAEQQLVSDEVQVEEEQIVDQPDLEFDDSIVVEEVRPTEQEVIESLQESQDIIQETKAEHPQTEDLNSQMDLDDKVADSDLQVTDDYSQELIVEAEQVKEQVEANIAEELSLQDREPDIQVDNTESMETEQQVAGKSELVEDLPHLEERLQAEDLIAVETDVEVSDLVAEAERIKDLAESDIAAELMVEQPDSELKKELEADNGIDLTEESELELNREDIEPEESIEKTVEEELELELSREGKDPETEVEAENKIEPEELNEEPPEELIVKLVEEPADETAEQELELELSREGEDPEIEVETDVDLEELAEEPAEETVEEKLELQPNREGKESETELETEVGPEDEAAPEIETEADLELAVEQDVETEELTEELEDLIAASVAVPVEATVEEELELELSREGEETAEETEQEIATKTDSDLDSGEEPEAELQMELTKVQEGKEIIEIKLNDLIEILDETSYERDKINQLIEQVFELKSEDLEKISNALSEVFKETHGQLLKDLLERSVKNKKCPVNLKKFFLKNIEDPELASLMMLLMMMELSVKAKKLLEELTEEEIYELMQLLRGVGKYDLSQLTENDLLYLLELIAENKAIALES